MGILRTKTIEPATGSTLTLGASGDTITVSSDSIKANTFKDAGGNTLFTSDGAGTLSSINSGLSGGGGPILISTHTASDSSSVDITSGIDSTYDEYMFVFTDINPASNGAIFTFQVNPTDDAGGDYDTVLTTSTAFATAHSEGGSGGTVGYMGNYDLAQSASGITLAREGGADADETCAGILHIFSPASTTYVKHFYSTSNQANYDGDPNSQHFFLAGYLNDTTAIDEIQFKMSSGNFDGTIQMYGIK